MICPRCGARQYGAAASCSNCKKGLLPGRSPRLRYFAAITVLAALLAISFLAMASERLPLAELGIAVLAIALGAALLVAIMPMSMAERYRRRALEGVLLDPQQSIRDLTRALELELDRRSLLIERARVRRLMGEYGRAAEDLREYLDRVRDEPRARVLRARLLLQHVEAAAKRPTPVGSTRVGV